MECRLRDPEADGSSYLDFDVSKEACNNFGFYYGDRVETPKGPATGSVRLHNSDIVI
jgi:hypothetical protein